MSYFYIITLITGLILTACGDTTPATTTATPSTVSEQPAAPTTPAVESTAPATGEQALELGDYDKERQAINDFVDQVNKDLAELTLKKTQLDMNGTTYNVLHYTDANGVLVKAKAVCDQDSWEVYAHPEARGPQKRVYASYMAKTDNPYEPISKQYYHIGSMQERDQAMVLVLDEAVKPMNGTDRQTWLDQYKAAAAIMAVL